MNVSSRSKSKSNSKSRKLRVLNKTNVYRSRSLNTIYENEYIDADFIHNHPKNMVRIRLALKESGKYKINKENVDKFINEQLTPIRRQAAKDLIDNTIYIQLKDVMNIVEELVIQIYERYQNKGEVRQPVMYCGEKNKSFYFFSCIALHYIKKHSYQIPIFVSKMPEEFLQTLNSPLIIIDDVSYSGSQLSEFIGKIHYYRHRRGLPILDFSIGLTALNDISLDKLSKVPIQKSARGTVIQEIATPYFIIYPPDRLYPSLVRKIGIERYFYINLFFNAWVSANMALYLDHKVADTTSTYKNTYVYGPIVPDNYDITNLIDYDICQLYFRSRYSDEVNQQFIRQFVDENPKFLEFLPNVLTDPILTNTTKQIKLYLHNKAISLDVIDKRHKPGIQFYPFIEKCSKSTQLKQIINNPDVKNMKYLFFMADKAVTNMREYEDLMDDVQETNRLIDLLDTHRCPNSFYKTELLKLI